MDGFALAGKHERQMCQRREIPARPDAALGRDDGMYTAIQHLAKRVDQNRTYTREPFCQGVGAKQYHCASDSLRKRTPYADAVRAQQIDLQFPNLVGSDADI